MRHALSALALASAALAAPAAHAGSAVVNLEGWNYLQSGSVQNTSDPGVQLTSFVYSLGTAEDGIAIWQISSSTGTHSDFLTADRYSTETWGGLNVASGGYFNFSGLDLDWIITAEPPVITDGEVDFVGTSLRNAYVTAYFSDGSFGSVELNQTGWTTNQTLTITSAVPEPGALAMAVAGLALVGGLARRRQQA